MIDNLITFHFMVSLFKFYIGFGYDIANSGFFVTIIAIAGKIRIVIAIKIINCHIDRLIINAIERQGNGFTITQTSDFNSGAPAISNGKVFNGINKHDSPFIDDSQ